MMKFREKQLIFTCKIREQCNLDRFSLDQLPQLQSIVIDSFYLFVLFHHRMLRVIHEREY